MADPRGPHQAAPDLTKCRHCLKPAPAEGFTGLCDSNVPARAVDWGSCAVGGCACRESSFPAAHTKESLCLEADCAHPRKNHNAPSAGKHGRAPSESDADEGQQQQKKVARVSAGSVRSHGSDIIDDSSAAVYILIGGGASFCNGTLIAHHSKLFVWTTAHALVDTSQPNQHLSAQSGHAVPVGLPLRAGIELLLARDTKQRPLQFRRLAWVRAHHTYDQFDWRGEAAAEAAGQAVPLTIEQKRYFDVLIFELDEMHDDLAEGPARRAYQPHLGGVRDNVAGRAFKPSLFPATPAHSPSAQNINDRILARQGHCPLGYMEHQAMHMHDSSGTGMIDRVGQLQGVIASCVSYAGAVRPLLILPRAFTDLWTEVRKGSAHVTTRANPNLAADQAAARLDPEASGSGSNKDAGGGDAGSSM